MATPAPAPPSPATPSPAARPAGAQRRVPAYALYGEGAARPLPEPVHGESIAARSRLHDWEIRPHRHEALFQILWLHEGEAQAWLDGRSVGLQGPAVVTVPSLSAHGFRFSPRVQGWVFTVAEPHLRSLLAPHPALAQALLRLQAGQADDGEPLAAAARRLCAELAGGSAFRHAAVDAAVLGLAVVAARVGAAAAPAEAGLPSRAMQHVRRLQALVEQRFREHPTQAALARQLGITPTQLNRASRQVLGHPALGVLHARLLLQAQRELACTDLSIQQIAFGLGFRDAAYFTRFFRRLAGLPPAAWRAAQRGVVAAPPG